MLKIEKTEPTKVSAMHCYACGEKFPRVGLLPGSTVIGLTIKCKACGELNLVSAQPPKNE